jgi:hypothetical protein
MFSTSECYPSWSVAAYLGQQYLFTSLPTSEFAGVDNIKEFIFLPSAWTTRHAINTLDTPRTLGMDPKVYSSYGFYEQNQSRMNYL